MMAVGRSKAKVYVEKDVRVTFADAAGVDEAKEELGSVDFREEGNAGFARTARASRVFPVPAAHQKGPFGSGAPRRANCWRLEEVDHSPSSSFASSTPAAVAR